MIQSLWTGASGMIAQQTNIDTIANNLSNVNTVGYKAQRAEFEDLLYQQTRLAGTPAAPEVVRPRDVQVGHGVAVTATTRLFTQGSLKQTDSPTDVAIAGQGFFRVVLPNGRYAYTRNGSFKIDADGQLVTAQGYKFPSPIYLPENAPASTLKIEDNGKVYATIGNNLEPTLIGQLTLSRFVNPAGLEAHGENLFLETTASGKALTALPGGKSMGILKQHFLENSAVSLAKEMVNMIVAQRAYETNSKTIQTSDSMLQTANAIKR